MGAFRITLLSPDQTETTNTLYVDGRFVFSQHDTFDDQGRSASVADFWFKDRGIRAAWHRSTHEVVYNATGGAVPYPIKPVSKALLAHLVDLKSAARSIVVQQLDFPDVDEDRLMKSPTLRVKHIAGPPLKIYTK